MFIFQCSMCPEIFQGHFLCQMHEKSHKNPYKCHYCPKVIDRRANFVKHVKIHRRGKVYKCEICNKNLSRRDNLTRHYENVHKVDYGKKIEENRKEFTIGYLQSLANFMGNFVAPKTSSDQKRGVFDFKRLADSHRFPSVSESRLSSNSLDSSSSSFWSPSSSTSPVPPPESSNLLEYFVKIHKA